MSDPTIDPVEEANQQRKAEAEAKEDEESSTTILEEAVEPLVRPFAWEKLTDEEIEMQRKETDEEERSS